MKLFDYFWKPNSVFSKFFVNCHLMFYFVYCNDCALKDANGACWCTCSRVALRVPEMCLWPANTRKNLELFEMHTCHWPGAQKGSDINEGNWLQFLFCFILLTGMVASVIGMSFFSAVFQVLDWSFLLLFDGNVCNWIPKVIWPRMDWFWGFLVKNGFFRWPTICMDWNLHELLNCYSFLTTSIFFDVLFEGFSGLFFKNACTFLT